MYEKKKILLLITAVLALALSACGTQAGHGKANRNSAAAANHSTNMESDRHEQSFPSFEGKDFDGNDVSSQELFAGNSVTVVNFWFTTCGPCVGELAELEKLNQELMEKGGRLIGINAFTLDGDEQAILEAKDVLAKKQAAYQNIYFPSDSEAGILVSSTYAYPTTYVVDRRGTIVGNPIVGAVTAEKQMDLLKKMIDDTVANDVK